MECLNKGLWHLGISDEACENAGGTWYRTPCVTIKETIDGRPSSFETAVVSASTGDGAYPFEATLDGCHEFCRSLPDYSAQMGMMTHQTEASSEISDCTCIYRNEKLPSRDSMPSYSKPSLPKFALTNSDGMALGLRPNIDCNATDDLMIETQIADINNPRQQFQVTQDKQVVSVQCPEKVLTNVLGGDGTSCTDGVGLQLKEYGFVPIKRSPTTSLSAFENENEIDIGTVGLRGSSTVSNDNTVRKVKLQHDSSSSEVLNIGEVEVYDQLGTINRALGKIASQSSDQGAFPASNAIDGNPSTFSHTRGDELGKLMLERGGWWTCEWIFLFPRCENNAVGTYRIGDASKLAKIELD
eukprot:scaffold31081_cov20-Cyclotella_meneghiniana.AAC.1